MGILFGNLFDNAIEACDKMEQGKNIFISVEISEWQSSAAYENSKRAGNNAKLQTEKQIPESMEEDFAL